MKTSEATAHSNPPGLPQWPRVQETSTSIVVSGHVSKPELSELALAILSLTLFLTLFLALFLVKDSFLEMLGLHAFFARIGGSAYYFFGMLSLFAAFVVAVVASRLRKLSKSLVRVEFYPENIRVETGQVAQSFPLDAAVDTGFYPKRCETSGQKQAHMVYGYEDIVLFSIDSKKADEATRDFVNCCLWAAERARRQMP